MPQDRHERVQRWLAGQPAFGEGTRLESIEPMAGGQSSDLLRMTCTLPGRIAPENFVIRREPRSKQIFLQADIRREYRVMDGLSAAGRVPVPTMLALESGSDVLDAPFLVMAEVNGEAPLGKPSNHVAGLLTRLSKETRAHLWGSAMEALVGIHASDWRTSHPFLAKELGSRSGLERHLDRLRRWYAWTTRGRPFAVTDVALDYLETCRPDADPEREVLLWGDARPGNMLFDPAGNVVAVLDFENALIGPASLDVGYWVMMDRFHADMIDVERLPGWPDEAETIARYEAFSGRTVADLDYYIVLAAFFIATTMIRATDLSIESGRLSSASTMGHANTATQIIAHVLGSPIPELSPDYVEIRQLRRRTVLG